MYPIILIAVLIQSLTIEAANHCRDKAMVEVVEKYIVKDDSTQYFNGFFTNVWIRKHLRDISKSSQSEYLKQPDGNIVEVLRVTDFKGKLKVFVQEVINKTPVMGEMTLMATDAGTNKKYYGKLYVYHADDNILGYYSCFYRGFAWNLNIQVKSEKKEKLVESGDNDVKSSLKAAEEKMNQIIDDYYKLQHLSVVQYDLNAL